MDYVYTNTFNDTRYGVDVCERHRLGPSVAVFEPGFLQVVLAYHEAGALPAGTLVKLYFAGGGYVTGGRALWGVPPIPEGLDLYLAMLGDSGIPWAVAVIDGDALSHPLTRTALERGGHLRVGLEDDPRGAGNVDLVRAAAAVRSRSAGPSPRSPTPRRSSASPEPEPERARSEPEPAQRGLGRSAAEREQLGRAERRSSRCRRRDDVVLDRADAVDLDPDVVADREVLRRVHAVADARRRPGEDRGRPGRG